MKNANSLKIRYCGADHNRYHILERGSGEFWTGTGWSHILDCAKVFREHRAAQVECRVIQRERYGWKPSRKFRLDVVVTLFGDDVADVSSEMLINYLCDAVRIDVETSVYGDGPGQGTYLEARLMLASLTEKTETG